MDVTAIQQQVQRIAEERDWEQYHTPKNLVMALSVEVAELVEEFQWLTPEQSEALQADPERLSRVTDEMADVTVYLLRLTDKFDIDLEQAIQQKSQKNAQKYPAARVRGSARKYTEYDR